MSFPRRPSFLVCAAALLLGPAAAALAMSDRDDIEKWCTHGSAVAAGRCFGYLLAVEDVLSRDGIEGVRACLPKEITLQEQHRIVVAWLRKNPGAIANSSAGLVARAYAASFPCAQ